MSIDLDLSAIQLAAKNSATNPLLTANVAKAANFANEKQPDSPPSPEKLAGLATLAGLAVSNGLLTHEKAPTVAPDPDPKPLPKFDQAQPWRALDREFQAHYWQCPACKAGGRTRGPLCPTGQQLSAAVEQAFAAT